MVFQFTTNKSAVLILLLFSGFLKFLLRLKLNLKFLGLDIVVYLTKNLTSAKECQVVSYDNQRRASPTTPTPSPS